VALHQQNTPFFYGEGNENHELSIGLCTLIDASKVAGLEVNVEITKYMLVLLTTRHPSIRKSCH
jgi:CII-binding regulator of phage lambda lysogenization HflD